MSDLKNEADKPVTPPSNVARSSARLKAVQALYQLEMSGGLAENIIRQFTLSNEPDGADGEEAGIAEADLGYFTELVRGVTDRKTQINEMIQASLEERWPAERLEVLLQAILQCGAFELMSQSSVPARVVISEYLAVADAFFEGKEPGLVNAVLDRIARLLRSDELVETEIRG